MSDRFDSRPHVKGRRLNVLPDNPDAADEEKAVGLGRFPKWLHRKMPQGGDLWKTHGVLDANRMPTVCEEARCPNLLECYSHKTATFLAMGSECTRACGFCDIDFATAPIPLEADEPERLARSAKELGLKHVVITMVARDDVEDGGAEHLAKIIERVREECDEVTIEVLTSDFQGKEESLRTVLAAQPEIFNHNVETVRRLTPRVRHKATYERTLHLLSYVKESGQCQYVKSGLMVGLGESEEEVHQTLRDLHGVGCDLVTIGHYLQPNRHKLRVKNFVTPEQFKAFADFGHDLGIKHVYSGPFVRSSYNAGLVFEKLQESSNV